MHRTWLLSLALGVIGCSVPKEAEFPDVQRQVERRTGHVAFWNQGGARDAEVANAVRGMLRHPLAPAEAVQVALLNNPRIQATYEELTIAQADVVQAGLLKNPVFTAQYHVPIGGGGTVPHFDFGVEQDFLDILMIPAKKRLARAAFEGAKLRVGAAIVDLAYDVRSAYFTMQGAEQVARMRGAVLEAASASVALAERQHQAGNISDLDLANELALFEQIRLELGRSQAEMVAARERLNRLMGLWGQDTQWSLAERMPELPPVEAPLDHLESLAIAYRLDIAAAYQDVQARASALSMATDWRWVPGVSAGAGIDRESDGPLSAGPQGSVVLPLFDQKQAVIASLRAEYRRSDLALRGLAIDVRSNVREARARLLYQRGLVEYYRTNAIPLRERIVSLSQEQYNAMLLGVYQLLQAKQAEVGTYREYIEAVRDYWIARSELSRACGGRLPGGVPATLVAPPPAGVGSAAPPSPAAAHRHEP